ncbi:MAG: YbaK/EbsC family protein, partial [Chloroflexi bacterium]|nr:YbaK/EbsC family protein [Chloroflexota bacterium]
MALSPENVQAALDALQTGIRIRFLETSTATAQEAAESIGTSQGSIVKSLCFLIAGEPILVLAAGDRKVSDRALAAHYGVSRKQVRLADVETTLRVTGYAPGGVPPIVHAQPLPILIDASLARFETLYAAAGSPHAIFPISYE